MSNYLTFCPHCESNLPARTYRNHHERYYNADTNSWEKDVGVLAGSSDEDEAMFMETPFETIKIFLSIIR